MDAVEKFAADAICSVLKITDPAKVAAVEAAAPKIVDGVIAIIGVIAAARGK